MPLFTVNYYSKVDYLSSTRHAYNHVMRVHPIATSVIDTTRTDIELARDISAEESPPPTPVGFLTTLLALTNRNF